MSKLLFFLFGPRLLRLENVNYSLNWAEAYGNFSIELLALCSGFLKYTSPFLLLFAYRRGYVNVEAVTNFVRENNWRGMLPSVQSLQPYAITLAFCTTLPFLLRGVGRYYNPAYQEFYKLVVLAKKGRLSETQRLAKSDFNFNFYAPIAFRASYRKDFPIHEKSWFNYINPLNLLSYYICHVIGVRLVYPGCWFINSLSADLRSRLRQELQYNKGAQRLAIMTSGGHIVDTLFVDNRGKTPFGNILVVCCEGNAGYYEAGTTMTPLQLGYSVLGWQHPGFSSSSGKPHPHLERRFIEAVMQFAMAEKREQDNASRASTLPSSLSNGLGFASENIVVIGWSIGGYTATHAAASSPQIRYLMLDATFDLLEPVAVSKMPPLLSPAVRLLMRSHFDLNVAGHLDNYHGPVVFVRRTQDEMISTDPNHMLETNRANPLIAHFLKFRYPQLFENEESERILAHMLTGSANDSRQWCETHLQQVREMEAVLAPLARARRFPVHLPPVFLYGDATASSSHSYTISTERRKALFHYLLSKHLRDFQSAHNNQLQSDLFFHAWTADPASSSGSG